VHCLELRPFEAADLEVEVGPSGIRTGTERLLWDCTMPPLPGLGYPLVPGYETVVRVGASTDPSGPAMRSFHPDEETRKNYTSIVDVSGDGSILNGLISRLTPGGEVVLDGFYKQDLGFAFAPAFMREATLRIAAQWQKQDPLAVTALAERGALSLEDLITHTFDPGRAREADEVAFGDPQCLKMMIDWQA
jgi:threonine dehydrogenase-like Zn-dependent dehydrogenase